MGAQRAKQPAPDIELAVRLRRLLVRRKGISEKRMFGGYCFLANGNMIGGVTGDEDLCVRVGPDAYEDALARPHAREMDFTGRPLKGLVYVDAAGVETDPELKEWIERGLAFARSLPPK